MGLRSGRIEREWIFDGFLRGQGELLGVLGFWILSSVEMSEGGRVGWEYTSGLLLEVNVSKASSNSEVPMSF